MQVGVPPPHTVHWPMTPQPAAVLPVTQRCEPASQQFPSRQVPSPGPPHSEVHVPPRHVGLAPGHATQEPPSLPHAEYVLPGLQVPVVQPPGIWQQPPWQRS